MYSGKWKPSRSQKIAFAKKMDEVDDFCSSNHISRSSTSDSYYFKVNGKDYRVSNHSVEASKVEYHPLGRKKETQYIHASKVRIKDIFNDLKNGYELDGRGFRK